MARMTRRDRVVGTVALVVAAVLAVVAVITGVRAPGTGDWTLPSSAAVVAAAAVSQWAAGRARGRGGRLLGGELALLVVLGLVGLALCGVDFVTGARDARAFTVLFAAAVILVVGGTVGTYAHRPGASAGRDDAGAEGA